MERRCAGRGLLLAGAIVTVIGLAAGVAATLEIPRGSSGSIARTW